MGVNKTCGRDHPSSLVKDKELSLGFNQIQMRRKPGQLGVTTLGCSIDQSHLGGTLIKHMGLIVPPGSLQEETTAINAIWRGLVAIPFLVPHDEIKVDVIDGDLELASVVLFSPSEERLQEGKWSRAS